MGGGNILDCRLHSAKVRQSDVRDPAVEMVRYWVDMFERTVNILFVEGQIMTMKHTYTAQILKFFRNPSAIFAAKHAIFFVRPDGSDLEAMFEPLERMRVITGNVLQCLRAAVPSTCWRHQFSCFGLPNPLGPNKPGRDSSKAWTRKCFLRIFKNARHHDAEKTLSQMLKLLPAAEKHAKTGLDNRQSWAAASLEFPELHWGREGVTTFLGAYITTSNLERFLRTVGRRREISTGVFMNDIVLCDLLAPLPGQVAETPTSQAHGGETPRSIIPRGPYLSAIVRCYHQIFGGRRWKREPKPRRNLGLHRDVDKVARQRKRKGQPITEGTFIRNREKELRQVLKETPEERARKRAKCSHGPVPADTGKYLSPAIAALRAKAEARGKRLMQKTIRTPKNKERQVTTWVGKKRAADARSGQTLHAPQLVLALVGDECPSTSLVAVEGMLGQDGVQVGTWPSYVREVVSKGRSPEAAMVVVTQFASPPWKNWWALACMIVGGFLTSEAWLATAVSQTARPVGLFYPGLLKKEMKLHICDDLEMASGMLCDLLRALDAEGCIVLTSYQDLREAWNKYLGDRGVRSQPWQKMVAVCAGAESKAALTKDLRDVERAMVVTLPDFLSRHCRARREVACAGCWIPATP